MTMCLLLYRKSLKENLIIKRKEAKKFMSHASSMYENETSEGRLLTMAPNRGGGALYSMQA